METINKAVDAAVDTITRTLYGNVEDTTEQENQHTKQYKPTEHQVRDETIATPPPSQDTIPTQGPGQATYANRPIVTTTNETSKLTDQSPNFQNLSIRSGESPVKNTGSSGHRRTDSGHAEAEGISERFARTDSSAHQRYGYEKEDDGIKRTLDEGSLSTEGYPRPKFVGDETGEDGIRRADGRDRVQFDNESGSTGNLKPSGEPSPERPRQGSTGKLPHADFGSKSGLPQGARIGTVQGGTVRDRQQSRELEDAQTAQSGGFGGTPAMFGTMGGYDSTGISQAQDQQQHSKPTVQPSSKDSNLQQTRSVLEDTTQDKPEKSHPSTDKRGEDVPASSIPGVPQLEKGVTEDILQGKPAEFHPSTDKREEDVPASSIPGVPTQHPSSRDADLQQPKSTLEDPTQSKTAHKDEDTAFRPATADQKSPSTTRPDAGGEQTSHPPAHMFTTSFATIGPQRSGDHPSSSNEPHSQGGTTNPATTNAVSPMGPGLTKGTHGPVEPSVGANPAHAQQQTQKHQGSDRPSEEPQGHIPQPGEDRKGEEEKKNEPGHLWVKTSGTVSEGGDFDAAKPGAGKEADRLLEQAGVHRTLDPKAKKDDEVKGVKDSHYNTTTTSGNPANPTHHLDSAADGGRGSHGGLHLPGILHHHDRKKDVKETSGEESGHKGFTEKIKEKLKLHKE